MINSGAHSQPGARAIHSKVPADGAMCKGRRAIEVEVEVVPVYSPSQPKSSTQQTVAKLEFRKAGSKAGSWPHTPWYHCALPRPKCTGPSTRWYWSGLLF